MKKKNMEKRTKAMNRLEDGQERDILAERNYRLLQMLPKDSEPYTSIV